MGGFNRALCRCWELILRLGRYRSSLVGPRGRPPRPLQAKRTSRLSRRRHRRQQGPVVCAHAKARPDRIPTSHRGRPVEADRRPANAPPLPITFFRRALVVCGYPPSCGEMEPFVSAVVYVDTT